MTLRLLTAVKRVWTYVQLESSSLETYELLGLKRCGGSWEAGEEGAMIETERKDIKPTEKSLFLSVLCSRSVCEEA